MSVALRALGNLDVFCGVADSYSSAGETLPALAAAVRVLEEWARSNAGAVTGDVPDATELDSVREGWLAGVGLQAL